MSRLVVAVLLAGLAFGATAAHGAPALERILIGDDAIPSGFRPLPELTGPIEPLLRRLRADPARRAAVERSLGDIESMERSYMRAWVNRDGTQITAMVFDAGPGEAGEEEAAEYLADSIASFRQQRASTFSVAGVREAHGFVTLDYVAVTFRRGPLNFFVAVAADLPDTVLAARLARAQAAAAPEGATSPGEIEAPRYRGPRSYLAGQIAITFAMAVLFYLLAVRRIPRRGGAAHRRETAVTGPPVPPPPAGVRGPPRRVAHDAPAGRADPVLRHDVSAAVRLRRRAARAVAVAKLAGSGVCAVALLPVLWPDSLPWLGAGLALVALAIATERGSAPAALALCVAGLLAAVTVTVLLVPVVTGTESGSGVLGRLVACVLAAPVAPLVVPGTLGVLRARRGRSTEAFPDGRSYVARMRTGYRRLFTGGRRVKVTLLLAAAALALLLAYVLVLASADIGEDPRAPESRQDEAADFMRLATMVGLACACLLAGVALYRRARLAALLAAEDLMARDRRLPVLLLRSFADDSLTIRTHHSSRHAWLEGLGRRRSERFEEVVAGHLWRYGPVIAVAEPGTPPAGLGAARASIPDATWTEDIQPWIAGCAAMVVVLGRSAGLAWEVGQITALGLWHKTIVVFPPLPEDALGRRWHELRTSLAAADAPMASLSGTDVEGAVVVVWTPDAGHTCYTARGRGEWDYEVALLAAAARLSL